MAHVRRSNRGHYKAAERLVLWHRRLGVTTATCTAVVGTSIFATINALPDTGWRIGAGLLTIASAVLATLQTALDLDSRAAEHRAAGAGYGRLRRRFEMFLAAVPGDRLSGEALTSLIHEMDELALGAPLIPSGADRRAARAMAQTATHPYVAATTEQND